MDFGELEQEVARKKKERDDARQAYLAIRADYPQDVPKGDYRHIKHAFEELQKQGLIRPELTFAAALASGCAEYGLARDTYAESREPTLRADLEYERTHPGYMAAQRRSDVATLAYARALERSVNYLAQ
jgi:hypothetical protein